MMLQRHDKNHQITTQFDPIEDLLNLMSNFRSKEFTSDVLKNIHGFTSPREINETTKLVKLHLENAMGLGDQAFSGPTESCFLPLYYSTLNFNKILLLVLGKRQQLAANRWHGASYRDSQMSRKFLNEEIYIANKGTIPLIYNTLMGSSIPNGGVNIKLEDIYSSISNIGAEYEFVTGHVGRAMPCTVNLIQDDVNGHYLKVEIQSNSFTLDPPGAKTLKAFKGLKMVQPNSGPPYYTTKRVKDTFENFVLDIKSKANRNLINDGLDIWNNWMSYTISNGKNHVFNEEMCITLAYFHLSNVVRYNPEHLNKIMNSRYWPILLALRK